MLPFPNRAYGPLPQVVSWPHLDPGIGDAATLTGRQGKDWIQVNFTDLRNLLYQSGQTQENLLDGLQITEREASGTREV